MIFNKLRGMLELKFKFGKIAVLNVHGGDAGDNLDVYNGDGGDEIEVEGEIVDLLLGLHDGEVCEVPVEAMDHASGVEDADDVPSYVHVDEICLEGEVVDLLLGLHGDDVREDVVREVLVDGVDDTGEFEDR